MLLSPLFMLLYSATLTIAVLSLLVSRWFGWRSWGGFTAWLIGRFKKFDHISQYMPEVLHWLPFPQGFSYRIASLVWQCLSGWAPSYLRELCRPLSFCAGHRTLRSSVQGNLVVPFARSAAMQTGSFSVVGPTTWNELPIALRHLPIGACSQFHHLLKTVLFRLAWVGSASEWGSWRGAI